MEYTPALLALDWGTSSLRAYLIDVSGQVIVQRKSLHGIMHLPTLNGVADHDSSQRFEQALQLLCADWLQAYPNLPILACGMVGSAQGWKEAKYHSLPCRISDIANALTVVPRNTSGSAIHITPGLIQHGALPNVMRGEETQIAGVLHHLSQHGDMPERLLIGLPGTHNKWALVESSFVTQFTTFMTGEVYAILKQYSLLGRTMSEPAKPDVAAFRQGIRVSRSSDASLGLLSNIFSTRTLGLTGTLAPDAQPDYLSGLLIGHELSALVSTVLNTTLPVILCGEPALCERYAIAFKEFAIAPPSILSEVTPSGLWWLAQNAQLV